MGDNMKEKGRAAIYSMAGIYLLYLAWQMFSGRAGSTGGEYILVWIGIGAFLVLGAGLIIFSFRIMKKNRLEDKNGAIDR